MSHSCAKCGHPAGQSVRLDKNSLVIFAATHAEYEQLAWRCSNCNKVICGRCAFPRWQAMKAETGLSASALAAKLESDPDALFSESATCPFCRRSMDPIEEAQAGALSRRPRAERQSQTMSSFCVGSAISSCGAVPPAERSSDSMKRFRRRSLVRSRPEFGREALRDGASSSPQHGSRGFV